MILLNAGTLTSARLLGISLAAGIFYHPGLQPGAALPATDRPLPAIEHRLARWPDGTPRLATTVVNDAYEGEYRTWYPSGAPYELRHFVHGREEGLQQSWTESGVLFLNYEVRSGRRYGFINARPCLPVQEDAP